MERMCSPVGNASGDLRRAAGSQSEDRRHPASRWREVGAAWWQEKHFSENGAEGLIGMGGYLDPYLHAAQCGAWPADRALIDHADLLRRIEPYRRAAA